MAQAENASGEPQRAAQAILEQAPHLDKNSGFYWKAFWELATDRPQGLGGLAPIPFSSLRAYADEFNIDDREAFFEIIRTVDGAYLELNQPDRKP